MSYDAVNVVFDPQIFSLQEYGGISRYFVELATHLHGIGGIDVEVCSPLYASRYFSNIPPSIINARASIPARRYFKYSRHIFTAVNMALFMRRLSKRSFDIAHHTYYWPLPKRLPVRARVTTVHDMIDDLVVPSRYKSRFKRLSVRQADHVICVSEYTRKTLLELYDIAPEKVTVVHHGKPEISVDASCEEHGLRPYILYVGPRTGYKNFSRLFAAYAASKRIKQDFLLVCFGGGTFSAQEKAAFAAEGIEVENIVYFSGGDTILHALYRGARLFVYPSMYEGFGLPPLEAMTLGAPVACSNVTSIPEIVGGAGEYFDPEDVGSMVHAMEAVLYSDTRRSELVKLGRERSINFSWGKCAQETLNVYRTVLQGR